MERGEGYPQPCFGPNMEKGLLLNYRKNINLTISYNLIGENDEPTFFLVQHNIVFL